MARKIAIGGLLLLLIGSALLQNRYINRCCTTLMRAVDELEAAANNDDDAALGLAAQRLFDTWNDNRSVLAGIAEHSEVEQIHEEIVDVLFYVYSGGGEELFLGVARLRHAVSHLWQMDNFNLRNIF